MLSRIPDPTQKIIFQPSLDLDLFQRLRSVYGFRETVQVSLKSLEENNGLIFQRDDFFKPARLSEDLWLCKLFRESQFEIIIYANDSVVFVRDQVWDWLKEHPADLRACSCLVFYAQGQKLDFHKQDDLDRSISREIYHKIQRAQKKKLDIASSFKEEVRSVQIWKTQHMSVDHGQILSFANLDYDFLVRSVSRPINALWSDDGEARVGFQDISYPERKILVLEQECGRLLPTSLEFYVYALAYKLPKIPAVIVCKDVQILGNSDFYCTSDRIEDPRVFFSKMTPKYQTNPELFTLEPEGERR